MARKSVKFLPDAAVSGDFVRHFMK